MNNELREQIDTLQARDMPTNQKRIVYCLKLLTQENERLKRELEMQNRYIKHIKSTLQTLSSNQRVIQTRY